jgi:AraC-like DNA-binding protein
MAYLGVCDGGDDIVTHKTQLASLPRLDAATFEHISIPSDRSFLWRLDDYPWSRSLWNYHPEVEIHLILHSSGLAYVGDHIGEFEAGQLVLLGSNLPHNFVTPGVGKNILRGREIVVQFDPNRLLNRVADFPELGEMRQMLGLASLGIEFTGEMARTGRDLLQRMGHTSPLSAFSLLLDLLALMSAATEYRVLASQQFADDFRPGTPAELKRLSLALEYMQARFAGGITLPEVARHVGLSDSAFSRFFRAQTGNVFSQHLLSLRIWAARRMIAEDRLPITEIAFEAGFGNIANFNRMFLRHTGMTPSRYRKVLRQRELAKPIAIIK